MNARLSTCLVEASGVERGQKELVRFCSKSKDGSSLAADWIGEIKKVWARGSSSTLDLARVVSAAKNRLQRHYGQHADVRYIYTKAASNRTSYCVNSQQRRTNSDFRKPASYKS